MSQATDVITVQAISGAMDGVYGDIRGKLERLSDPLSSQLDEGGWTVRQFLSHVAGALYRIPIHASIALAGQPEVPIEVGNTCWISEWETAPVRAFAAAIESSYHGNKAFLATLTEADLDTPTLTPFGAMSLGQLLLASFAGHIGQFHGGQFEAFLVASEA